MLDALPFHARITGVADAIVPTTVLEVSLPVEQWLDDACRIELDYFRGSVTASTGVANWRPSVNTDAGMGLAGRLYEAASTPIANSVDTGGKVGRASTVQGVAGVRKVYIKLAPDAGTITDYGFELGLILRPARETTTKAVAVA